MKSLILASKSPRRKELLEKCGIPFTVEAAEIDAYVATNEADDKAGAYGIQGLAGKFITRIEGDYYTIVGLPLAQVYQELKNFSAY